MPSGRASSSGSSSPRPRCSATRTAPSVAFAARDATGRARLLRAPLRRAGPGVDPHDRCGRDHRRNRPPAGHERLRRPGDGPRERAPRVRRGLVPDGVPYVFAAGDAVHGPTDITRAVGEGRKAAHQIDAWLSGRPFDDWDTGSPSSTPTRCSRARRHTRRVRRRPAAWRCVAAPADFRRGRDALTEADAPPRAGRCIDCAVCSECNECVEACPVDGCIDLRARDAAARGPRRGRRRLDRLQAVPGGPQAGVRLRPVQERHHRACRWTGCSRRPGRSTRSCGRATARSPSASPTSCAPARATRPSATRSARASAACTRSSRTSCSWAPCPSPTSPSTTWTSAPPASAMTSSTSRRRRWARPTSRGASPTITETPEGNLVLTYEDIEHGGAVAEAEYDLVVLAVGVQPNHDAERLFEVGELALDAWGYVAEPDEDVNPGQTNIPGVFVAGAASGAKDIADSILHAGAAVAQVAAHLERTRTTRSRRSSWCRHERRSPHALAPAPEAEPGGRRIGVYVCHCGGNISDYVDVDRRDRRHPRRRRRRRREDRDVHLLRRDAAGDRRRHRGATARRPRRRVVLAQAPHVHVPRRRPARRA